MAPLLPDVDVGNIMSRKPGGLLTTGQCYRANLDQDSYINKMGIRSGRRGPASARMLERRRQRVTLLEEADQPEACEKANQAHEFLRVFGSVANFQRRSPMATCGYTALCLQLRSLVRRIPDPLRKIWLTATG